MNLPRRSALLILLLGTALLLGFFFRESLVENFVQPLAILAWLFGRTLRSFDQVVYWVLVIVSIALYSFLRNLGKSAGAPAAPPPDSNVTLEKINHWRIVIPLTLDEIDAPNVLKQNMAKMLTEIHASRQPESAHWEVAEALRQRRIPLPGSIYGFLFPAPPAEKIPFPVRITRDLWQAPVELARRLSGRERAGYYRSIEKVLTYMESLMEKKHDNKPFGTPPH
jgi:hypothetical protein